MAFPFKTQDSSGAICTKEMGSCREPKPEHRMNAGYLKRKIWMRYNGS